MTSRRRMIVVASVLTAIVALSIAASISLWVDVVYEHGYDEDLVWHDHPAWYEPATAVCVTVAAWSLVVTLTAVMWPNKKEDE